MHLKKDLKKFLFKFNFTMERELVICELDTSQVNLFVRNYGRISKLKNNKSK
jgi:hypothetical protein